MEEHGLKLALDEVQLDESKDKPLDLCDGRFGLILVKVRREGVDIWPERNDEGVEEDGTKVFDNEDKSPAQLESYTLVRFFAV